MKKAIKVTWIIVMILCLVYSIWYGLKLNNNTLLTVVNMITMICSSFTLGMWTRDSFEIRD